MALGMNLNNNGNNIKKAEVGKPKKNFSDFNISKKPKNKAKLTTIKVDTQTLAEIDFMQYILGIKKHEDTLKYIISNTLPKFCKKHHINQDKEDFVIKMLKNK